MEEVMFMNDELDDDDFDDHNDDMFNVVSRD